MKKVKNKIKIEYSTYQIPIVGGYILLTHDKNMIGGVLTKADEDLLSQPAEGTTTELGRENFQTMAENAAKLVKHIDDFVTSRVNKPRALFVRDLRLNQKYSWRSIALRCYAEWGGNWKPLDNQIVGQRICEQASQILNEFIE